MNLDLNHVRELIANNPRAIDKASRAAIEATTKTLGNMDRKTDEEKALLDDLRAWRRIENVREKWIYDTRLEYIQEDE